MSIHVHDGYLQDLIAHLDTIGEKKEGIKWIMKDGIWLREDGQRKTLCDLIVVYDGFAVPIELKGSKEKKYKAHAQLKAGGAFIRYELHSKADYGVFVVYGHDRYFHERLSV